MAMGIVELDQGRYNVAISEYSESKPNNMATIGTQGATNAVQLGGRCEGFGCQGKMNHSPLL